MHMQPAIANVNTWRRRDDLPFRRPRRRVGADSRVNQACVLQVRKRSHEWCRHVIDLDRLLSLVRALNREGVEYSVVGAVALGLHGVARATEILDLFVRPTPDNVARLRRALSAVWSDPDIDSIVASDLAGDFPTIRYGAPDGSLTLDLLARLGERFGYDDIETTAVELEGEPVRAATPRMLYVMKRDTVRPQDHADAAALRRAFEVEDE